MNCWNMLWIIKIKVRIRKKTKNLVQKSINRAKIEFLIINFLQAIFSPIRFLKIQFQINHEDQVTVEKMK